MNDDVFLILTLGIKSTTWEEFSKLIKTIMEIVQKPFNLDKFSWLLFSTQTKGS